MKTPSNDLFILIKSLSTREKGYFKMFSIKKSSNKNEFSYLKLFNAIDMLKTHDEALLLTKLKKIGFQHSLKRAKSYLTNAIYNSLKEYHADTSVHSEMHNLLHLAYILIEKKLAVPANRILLKAEKLAQEYALYEHLMIVGSLKARNLISTINAKELKGYIKFESRKEKTYLERLKNSTELRNLYFQIQAMAPTSYSKAKNFNKIRAILRTPVLSSPDKALSFTSLHYYYTIHVSCSFLLDECDIRTYKRQKEWVNYLESDKTKLAKRAHAYLSALTNLIGIQVSIGKINEAEKSYQKTSDFYFSLAPKIKTKNLLSQFAGCTCNYMAANINSGYSEKSFRVWEQIKNSISFIDLAPNLLMAICTNVCYLYGALGKYHDALKWVNKILHFKEKNLFDLQAMTRTYSLVVHYELGNYDILPYMARSTQRFLVKYNYFSEFEKIMVSFFEKRIYKTKNSEEKIQAFSQLEKQLEELRKGNLKLRALEYFDYMSWIESKIKNRPFVEIVREKADSLQALPKK